MNDINLCGMYNKIICNYCGPAAGIIFDHLIHSDHIYNGNVFCLKDLEREIQFMNKKDLSFGLLKLITHGYVSGELGELMSVANKMLAFLPSDEE